MSDMSKTVFVTRTGYPPGCLSGHTAWWGSIVPAIISVMPRRVGRVMRPHRPRGHRTGRGTVVAAGDGPQSWVPGEMELVAC